jgi:hypothetical protein
VSDGPNINVFGTGDPTAVLELFDWTTLVARTRVDRTGNWQVTLQVSSSENHIYRARVLDEHNQYSEYSDPCAVAVTAPDATKGVRLIPPLKQSCVAFQRLKPSTLVVPSIVLMCVCSFIVLRHVDLPHPNPKHTQGQISVLQRAVDWYLPTARGSSDQALLAFSNSNPTRIVVQIRAAKKRQDSVMRVGIPARSDAEVALPKRLWTAALTLHATARITVQRFVVRKMKVFHEYGRHFDPVKGKAKW